jgi:hypothetical protein
MSELADDPYTAFYDFRPLHRAHERRQVPDSEPATILHELGRAGSPCTDLSRGTKVEVECPSCGRTGRAVGWEGRRDFYVCEDCETVLTVPY